MTQVASTPISCGVHMFHGFQRYDTSARGGVYRAAAPTPQECFMDVVWKLKLSNKQAAYNYGSSSAWRFPCAMYVFSDVVGRAGDLFGLWLSEQFPGTVTRSTGRNPNSMNDIATYVWVLPGITALRKHPLWGEVDLRKPRVDVQQNDTDHDDVDEDDEFSEGGYYDDAPPTYAEATW